MDSLFGEEVLLLVLYFCGVLQGGVHITVAVGVGDPLHGSGGCFAECYGGAGAFYQDELVLLAC